MKSENVAVTAEASREKAQRAADEATDASAEGRAFKAATGINASRRVADLTPAEVEVVKAHFRGRKDAAAPGPVAELHRVHGSRPAPKLVIPDEAWEDLGDGRLMAQVQIGTAMFHAEALEVETTASEQRGVTDSAQNQVELLAALDSPTGPWETLEIKGKNYVLFITPFCD